MHIRYIWKRESNACAAAGMAFLYIRQSKIPKEIKKLQLATGGCGWKIFFGKQVQSRVGWGTWKLKNTQKPRPYRFWLLLFFFQHDFILSNSRNDVGEKQKWKCKDFTATKSDYPQLTFLGRKVKINFLGRTFGAENWFSSKQHIFNRKT